MPAWSVLFVSSPSLSWMSCRAGRPMETRQEDDITLLVIDFQGS